MTKMAQLLNRGISVLLALLLAPASAIASETTQTNSPSSATDPANAGQSSDSGARDVKYVRKNKNNDNEPFTAKDLVRITPDLSGGSDASMQAAPGQVYVINRFKLIKNFPKAIRMANDTVKEKEGLKKAVENATNQFELVKSQGKYSASQVQELQAQWQSQIDKLGADVDKKLAGFEKELTQDIEAAIVNEVRRRGISRESIRYTDEYTGADAIDITDNVIRNLSSTPPTVHLPPVEKIEAPAASSDF